MDFRNNSKPSKKYAQRYSFFIGAIYNSESNPFLILVKHTSTAVYREVQAKVGAPITLT